MSMGRDLVGALAGLGLIVAMFLPWYSAGDADVTAWQAFSVVDLVLIATAIASLSVPVVVLFRISVSYPIAGSSIAAGFGVIALICVVWRLIDPPGSGLSIEFGAWLGLIFSAGAIAGGYLGMQEPGAPAAD